MSRLKACPACGGAGKVPAIVFVKRKPKPHEYDGLRINNAYRKVKCPTCDGSGVKEVMDGTHV